MGFECDSANGVSTCELIQTPRDSPRTETTGQTAMVQGQWDWVRAGQDFSQLLKMYRKREFQNAIAQTIKILWLGYQAWFQEPFNPKYNIREPLRTLLWSI